MEPGATITRLRRAVCSRAAVNAALSGEETATFSFNLAPSVYVLTVTKRDGSVVRHVTTEDRAVSLHR